MTDGNKTPTKNYFLTLFSLQEMFRRAGYWDHYCIPFMLTIYQMQLIHDSSITPINTGVNDLNTGLNNISLFRQKS